MHAPIEDHPHAMYRILRYLKRAPEKGLFLEKNLKRSVEAYTDADWAGSIDDKRSILRNCTLVWGNLVTWWSKTSPWLLEVALKLSLGH